MNGQRPGMLVPALIGGVAAGVLSGIPVINCLCCLWIIGGAILASYLLAKDSPVSLTAGDGAIVGVFTGIVAAVVDLVISIPFQAVTDRIVRGIMERFSEYYQEMPSNLERFMDEGAAGGSFAWSVIGFVVSVLIFSVLGALGGIIGVSLFGKKASGNERGNIHASQNPGDRQP